MTRQTQKNEEIRLVEQMRQALGGTPAGQVQPTGEPDVCVVTSGRRIGIEVTELHQNSVSSGGPMRLQESERWIVVRRARAVAESMGMLVTDVAVHFNDNVPIQKSDRSRLVNELVRFVSAHLPTGEGSVVLDLGRHPGNSLPWVRTIRLCFAPVFLRDIIGLFQAPDGSRWTSCQSSRL